MTKNFKNIKFNRLIRLSNGGVVDAPLKNTNGMPIAIRKPISERGNDYYDYMRAMQLGYKPDETGHWQGRDYVTGDYLKLPGHPTLPLSVMYDILSGYDVTRNEEGRYRSTPKKLQYSNYFQNGGVVGGGDPPGTIFNNNYTRDKAYADSMYVYNKYNNAPIEQKVIYSDGEPVDRWIDESGKESNIYKKEYDELTNKMHKISEDMFIFAADTKAKVLKKTNPSFLSFTELMQNNPNKDYKYITDLWNNQYNTINLKTRNKLDDIFNKHIKNSNIYNDIIKDRDEIKARQRYIATNYNKSYQPVKEIIQSQSLLALSQDEYDRYNNNPDYNAALIDSRGLKPIDWKKLPTTSNSSANRDYYTADEVNTRYGTGVQHSINSEYINSENYNTPTHTEYRYLPIFKKPSGYNNTPDKSSTKSNIIKRQEELINAGYDIGGADGIWGNKSKTAWEDYQSKKSKEDTNKSEEVNKSEDTNKSEGMKRWTREQYDAYIKNKKGKTGNWISPFGEPVNLGGAKGDTFSTNMFGANNDNMKNKTRIPINYNSYGGKLIRRKSLGRILNKTNKLAMGGLFQMIGQAGEGIGNKVSEGAYNKDTGKYKTDQYAIGRGIYGAFNPAMAGIESINRGDNIFETALAFSGLGNIVGAKEYAKKINNEIDEKNNEINKANQLELDNAQQLRNLQSTYGTTDLNNYNIMTNNFNAYGGKLNRIKRSMLRPFGGYTSNIPDSNAIPIEGNDELVVNNQGGTQGSHETGQNIPAYDSNGQETAQVEPGEVIMELPNGEKYALSKRLGVAQKYLEYTQIKEKLSQEMIATDVFKRNAIKRELDSIDAKIQQLPAYQEQLKQQYGIKDEEVQQQGMEQQVPMAKYGRKLTNGGFTKYDVPIQPEQLVDEPDYTKLINNYNSLLNAPYSDNTNISNFVNPNTRSDINIYGGGNEGFLNAIRNNKMLDYMYKDNNTIPYRNIPALADESKVDPNTINFYKPNNNTMYNGGIGGGGNSSTYTGNLNGTTKPPNKLFNPKNLGTAKDIATTVLPFVDNIINYAMTKKTPKIPKPTFDKHIPLEERVNVENQISSIERSKKELFKDIDNNVSNVQQANAMKREISRKADDAMNSVYEKKENTEIGMRNENKLRRNIIDSSNNRLLDAYNMAEAQREFGIMQDHSTNLANASDDINNLMNRSDLKRNEKIELEAISKYFNEDVRNYTFADITAYLENKDVKDLQKLLLNESLSESTRINIIKIINKKSNK